MHFCIFHQKECINYVHYVQPSSRLGKITWNVPVDEVMGRKKEPVLPDKLNPDYLKLNDVNRAAIDAAIAALLKGQQSSD